MNTYRDAYDKAVAKADGIIAWHATIMDRMERVYAIAAMDQHEGVCDPQTQYMLIELHKQKLCAERDYRKAENLVKIAWTRFMNYGKRWE